MKRRKIYYVPGMISLILLPILCVWYLNDNKNVERCIELSTPERYIPNRNYGRLHFDTTLLSLPENKRKYINFKMNGNVINDENELISFNNHLLDIVKNEDTINGLHVTFEDNAKYNSFIKVIDICKKDSFWPLYAPYDNEFWYIHYNRNDSIKEFIRQRLKSTKNNSQSGYWTNDVVYIKPELPFWENNSLLSNSLKFWPFFIIYIVFSIISIRYIRNNYIKKTKQLNNNERFN